MFRTFQPPVSVFPDDDLWQCYNCGVLFRPHAGVDRSGQTECPECGAMTMKSRSKEGA